MTRSQGTKLSSLKTQDASCSMGANEAPWEALGAGLKELSLDLTLPTGQSFRWRQIGPEHYRGVIGHRIVSLRQTPEGVLYKVHNRTALCSSSAADRAALEDFFNLQVALEPMYDEFAQKDVRYREVSEYFPGARMLRQDPMECLFSFICSSNNHISRIHGMVERICTAYGTPLGHVPLPSSAHTSAATTAKPPLSPASPTTPNPKSPTPKSPKSVTEVIPERWHSFPTLEQLAAASEDDFRADGFGYRAKFITGTTEALLAKPEGGEAWLLSLRDSSYKEAKEALLTLPGVGPKVAACVCLFSLDKHSAIPVDTHVWQVALKHYTPQLEGKTLTPRIMDVVEDAFGDVFGEWAGWAHNVLFVADLASQKHRLPEHLRPSPAPKKTPSKSASPKNASQKTTPSSQKKMPSSQKKAPSSQNADKKKAKKRLATEEVDDVDSAGDDNSIWPLPASSKKPRYRRAIRTSPSSQGRVQAIDEDTSRMTPGTTKSAQESLFPAAPSVLSPPVTLSESSKKARSPRSQKPFQIPKKHQR
ncbi:8-oxoguanine glycosylase ogg1 [Cymbomonas tetramitiformis]|uniref:DNA-(apurinic or apyrimidinic site) lyase n=1 Tax=Cymbomonas tetramitiformis TaxID=36881 RepID=A0AAE0FRE5_9CHLO|nr:8-oxoguanine glycosylase ogg1 [Cymbomonas tetramitiformis]